jgi:hypothetical protein
MPANLPQQYHDIQRRLREEAETTAEKIECVEELLAVIPKHKGTDHLRADLRKRLSKLRTEADSPKQSGGRQKTAFHIDREGAGRVVVIGPPNVGKSSLVAALTHAHPVVSSAPFSTWAPSPGMLPFEDVQIQLIDTPPIAEQTEAELYDLIRSAEVILAVVDLQASPIEQLEDTLAALEARRIAPEQRRQRFPDTQRMWFRPLIVVANKDDEQAFDEDAEMFAELLEEDWPLLAVSASSGRHLEQLQRALYEALAIVRIYSKPPHKPVDRTRPFVIKRGGTVEDFAAKVHQELATTLKTARIWGSGVFDGQQVGRDHVLEDGDVVELHV